MVKHIKPPVEIPRPHFGVYYGTKDYPFNVFLAGSIEMGEAERWQDRVFKAIFDEFNDNKEFDEDYPCNINILNPRRDDWDSSWVQSINNDQFREQVEWELRGLEHSSVRFFYFDPNTKSPITLLELGLVALDDIPTIVVCPEGFWRKGNVDIVCERFALRRHDTFENGLEELIRVIWYEI